MRQPTVMEETEPFALIGLKCQFRLQIVVFFVFISPRILGHLNEIEQVVGWWRE